MAHVGGPLGRGARRTGWRGGGRAIRVHGLSEPLPQHLRLHRLELERLHEGLLLLELGDHAQALRPLLVAPRQPDLELAQVARAAHLQQPAQLSLHALRLVLRLGSLGRRGRGRSGRRLCRVGPLDARTGWGRAPPLLRLGADPRKAGPEARPARIALLVLAFLALLALLALFDRLVLLTLLALLVLLKRVAPARRES